MLKSNEYMIQLLVYRKEHDCNSAECTELTAYVRIDGKWARIGHYGSECKKFEPIDLEREERDRLDKESRDFTTLRLRQIKQESRASRKIIENELNMNNSFFKEQTRAHKIQNDTV